MLLKAPNSATKEKQWGMAPELGIDYRPAMLDIGQDGAGSHAGALEKKLRSV